LKIAKEQGEIQKLNAEVEKLMSEVELNRHKAQIEERELNVKEAEMNNDFQLDSQRVALESKQIDAATETSRQQIARSAEVKNKN